MSCSVASHFVFLRQDLSLSIDLSFQSGWLPSEAQGKTGLYFASSRIASAHYHTGLFNVCSRDWSQVLVLALYFLSPCL